MKKILLLLLLCCLGLIAKADQRLYLSWVEASKFLSYLNENKIKQVVIWCGCCDNESQRLITNTSYFIRKADDGEHYQLVLSGKLVASGSHISNAFDLTHIWINKDFKAENLAVLLSAENVDPCAPAFNWPVVEKPNQEGEISFPLPNEMPEFPGELNQFLSNNLTYPAKNRDRKQQGRAIIQFLIGEDGWAKDILVIQSSGYTGLDEEAKRVVTEMPQWKPATKHGQPIEFFMTLPIVFKMD